MGGALMRMTDASSNWGIDTGRCVNAAAASGSHVSPPSSFSARMRRNSGRCSSQRLMAELHRSRVGMLVRRAHRHLLGAGQKGNGPVIASERK
jgi:hypothetical protein